MTIRGYFKNAYCKRFEAAVVERFRHEGQLALVLDETYFYPTSGGQPADSGLINGVPVQDVFVRREDGSIVHVLDGEVWTESVTGEIAWARRFDHMQQHSGQHILSQAFIQTCDARTVGFHLTGQSLTIDLDRSDLRAENIEAAETLANQIIWEDRKIHIQMLPMDKAGQLDLRKLPEVDGDFIRIVEIEAFDRTACGGTHVSRTGAVGLIKIAKLEPQGDELRVEFVCGKRALVDYRRKNRIVTRLANEFTTGYWEIEQSVARLRDEVKQLQRQKRQQRGQFIRLLSQQLLNQAVEEDGARIVVAAFDDKEPDDLKILAGQIIENRDAVALLGLAGEKVRLVFARHENAPGAMNELLKSALQVLTDGAGGGSTTYAQGGGSSASLERVEKALARAHRLLIAQLH